MPELLIKKASAFERARAGAGEVVFLYIALALFFLAVATFGGLFLLNNAQRAAKEELIEQVRIKEENMRPELVSQIFLLDQRLTNMRNLLSSHVFTTNVLKLIEKNVHPQTTFSNFSFSDESKRIDMSGATASYLTLAQQIELFENDPEIDQVEFGGLSIGSNNFLGFQMAIFYKSGVLSVRPQ